MTVSVELTNLSMQSLQNAKLHAVVYEDTGKSRDRYLVRGISSTSFLTLTGHGTSTFELNSGIANSSGMHMVVMLKSTSGTILQAVLVQ